MPSISAFYGLIIYMYNDTEKYKTPHIRAEYQSEEIVVSIPDCEILSGNIPEKKLRLVRTWIHIHEEALMANWELSVRGESLYKIDPLKEENEYEP